MSLPFKFGKVVEKRFFVNRHFEIDFIKQNILSQINITLISPRRWGKSSLVHIATNELSKANKQIKVCHIDLFNIRTEEEFYKTFADSVIKASTTKWEEQIKLTKLFFKKLIPKLSFGVEESNSLSLSFDWEEVKKDPSEILNLPEQISKKKKIQFFAYIFSHHTLKVLRKCLRQNGISIQNKEKVGIMEEISQVYFLNIKQIH